MEFEGRSRMPMNLNMAPLIDVVLLLLIFFMLTSTYLVAEAIDLKLPESSSSAPGDIDNITVVLLAGGGVAVNGDRIEFDQVGPVVARLIVNQEEQTVMIKTDGDQPVQRLVDMMDQLRKANVTNVAIATQGRP